MLPDFNRLKIFYYIYTQQSTVGAAKLLHITQSGVSQHLKKLEEELQASLFTRVNRKLIPTAAGKKLYSTVSTFISHLENEIRDISEASDIPSGQLRIGAPFEFGRTYLPSIFASFHQKYPNVSFQLELGDPNVLFKMVSEGELDFAYIDILPIFIDTPCGLSAYTSTPIVKEEFVLACSKQYYEKNIHNAGYEELINQQYVSYKTDIALFRSWFKLHFEQTPSSLNTVFIADDARALIATIEKGVGIGMVVSHLISDQISKGTIIPLKPTRKKLDNTIACVQFKNKLETTTEHFFQEHLRNELTLISDLVLLKA